jgi:inositol polyphosphate 1-phosphatase
LYGLCVTYLQESAILSVDGTNEYIIGSQDASLDSPTTSDPQERIYSSGLHCVTVLIGAFHLQSGHPIAGVINQPFYRVQNETKIWQGRRFWGVLSKEGQIISHGPIPLLKSSTLKKKLAILSSSEDPELQKKLEKEFDLVFSSGAGYKLLTVVLGLADIYILSKKSTHFWDTCAPHAVLSSLRGGIVKYNDFVCQSSQSDMKESEIQLNYTITDQGEISHFANVHGLVAYRDSSILKTFLQCVEA